MFLNDLDKALKFTHVLLYADNTKIIVTGQNLSMKINKDLEDLSQWLMDSKLTFMLKTK